MNSRSMLLALVLVLGLGMLFAGCGNKAEVETETELPDVDTDVQEVPLPPVKEPVVEPQDLGPDYANMDPSEFGVEDIFFAYDQYELNGEAMSLLSRNARILREADLLILVSGHCDERGTVEYNLALGEKRANAVRDYLVSLGVARSNLRVTSYGENSPFAMGHDDDAWALNRRAHFERP